MSPEKIEDLVQKYLDGTSTAEERRLLDSWYRNQLTKTHEWEAESANEIQLIKEEMFNMIKKRIAPNRSRKFIPNFYRYAAASIVLVIATSTFFFYKSSQVISSDSTALERVVIAPGTNGAILTLADGKKITLDKHALANNRDNIAGIYKFSDGLLEYNNILHKAARSIVTNTLTTPRGNKFTLVLSDGTKVFMNAGSTLQYPETFTGSERIVKLTGEAYFEVVHNSKSPFKVRVRDQIIEDIGTSFNVSAYEDESFVSVTLVEGSVKIEKSENQVVINPGQNALTSVGNNVISVKSADLESDLAWRSDLFHFEDVKLPVVLKQIARWYDLEIEYEGSIPTKTINGEIYRNMNGAQVLTILKNLGVNFKLDGKKLTIENK